MYSTIDKTYKNEKKKFKKKVDLGDGGHFVFLNIIFSLN